MLVDNQLTQPRVSMLGTTHLLFEAPGDFDLTNQRRIWTLTRVVSAWPGVREAAPCMTNVMLTFDTPPEDPDRIEEQLVAAWNVAEPDQTEGRVVDVPVIYGGEYGPDLHEIAAHAKLPPEEVVRLHTESRMIVFAVGSHPGNVYLGGLDPRIAMPRRKVPRIRAEAGTVSIGGFQGGMGGTVGPSGWNWLGRTTLPVFDPHQDPPALLAPGDIVRFRAERVIL
ncbi:5-oxoprolinase subunit PxpB [Roseomonas terrae]|jgi:KipI family sensor histidine kinase inhibitor|uniref:5-oxoprolinase subunit PxpB n=1 Tax=Neoroseomonas terrae TaxID=424799 RepID=A0ABS5EBD2_9PROT|nr:5-oxoprolinase subunit PxpB [Neoroseomonas terrae]MBR0648330.1 5-oxoprolinase subunit PxpB [Neoroseomonas terrae]